LDCVGVATCIATASRNALNDVRPTARAARARIGMNFARVEGPRAARARGARARVRLDLTR
jgi:hypothetical protein